MSNVANIADHMALACDCGSARFALLRSDGIECHGCGMRMPMEWREYDATQCCDCCGKGWNDAWKKVSGHFAGGETFREECESCDGLGWVGPDAEKRAKLEKP